MAMVAILDDLWLTKIIRTEIGNATIQQGTDMVVIDPRFLDETIVALQAIKNENAANEDYVNNIMRSRT